LADPTVGIIAAAGFNEILSGKPVPSEKVVAFYAYDDPEIIKFGNKVYSAITSGGYRPSDLLYYFSDLRSYVSFSRALGRVWSDPPDIDAIARFFPTPGATALKRNLVAALPQKKLEAQVVQKPIRVRHAHAAQSRHRTSKSSKGGVVLRPTACRDCRGFDILASRRLSAMRVQVGRQRKEILQLQRANISTASAELLRTRMLAKIEGLCAERDRLKKEQGGPTKGRVLGGRSW
jgi:hypothetical protein